MHRGRRSARPRKRRLATGMIISAPDSMDPPRKNALGRPGAHVTYDDLLVFNANPDHRYLRTSSCIEGCEVGVRVCRNEVPYRFRYRHKKLLRLPSPRIAGAQPRHVRPSGAMRVIGVVRSGGRHDAQSGQTISAHLDGEPTSDPKRLGRLLPSRRRLFRYQWRQSCLGCLIRLVDAPDAHRCRSRDGRTLLCYNAVVARS